MGHNGPPVFWAIERGRERAVLELLVAHGADVHARHLDGRSVYQMALRYGNSEAAAYLAELGAATAAAPFDRFVDACDRGDLEAARHLIAENPQLLENLSKADHRAYVKLAERGKTATIAAMIDLGFPVNARGEHGQSALHWAAWHGWRETAAALLSRGAELEAVENEFGATPLGWAIHGCDNWPNPDGDYPGVVRLLLEAGAKVTVQGIWMPDDVAVADQLRAAGVKDASEE
jgi:ankyrin repeat protein